MVIMLVSNANISLNISGYQYTDETLFWNMMEEYAVWFIPVITTMLWGCILTVLFAVPLLLRYLYKWNANRKTRNLIIAMQQASTIPTLNGKEPATPIEDDVFTTATCDDFEEPDTANDEYVIPAETCDEPRTPIENCDNLEALDAAYEDAYTLRLREYWKDPVPNYRAEIEYLTGLGALTKSLLDDIKDDAEDDDDDF